MCFSGFHRSCQLAFRTCEKLKGSEEPLVSASRCWVSVVSIFAQLMGRKCCPFDLASPIPVGRVFIAGAHWFSAEASGRPGLSDRGLKECPAMPWRAVVTWQAPLSRGRDGFLLTAVV